MDAILEKYLNKALINEDDVDPTLGQKPSPEPAPVNFQAKATIRQGDSGSIVITLPQIDSTITLKDCDIQTFSGDRMIINHKDGHITLKNVVDDSEKNKATANEPNVSHYKIIDPTPGDGDGGENDSKNALAEIIWTPKPKKGK